MRFTDIVGHELVVSRLKRVIDTGRAANGYLFCGPEGVGKKTAALRFAAGLVCESKSGRPCGECPACRKVETGNHPDLVTVLPENGKKTISVDVIRNVIGEEVYVRPYLGGKKIFYVPDGSLLGTAAQNALLKVLEEPPEYVVFVLVAYSGDVFLPTIRSRAQEILFHPLPEREVEAYLRREHPGLGDNTAFVASFADGSIGMAKRLAEDEEFLAARGEVNGYLRKLAGNDTTVVQALCKYVGAAKDEQLKLVLRFMILWFRDVCLLKTGSREHLVNSDLAYELGIFAEKLSKRAAADSLDKLLILDGLSRSNANMAVASSSAILKIWEGMHEEGNRRQV